MCTTFSAVGVLFLVAVALGSAQPPKPQDQGKVSKAQLERQKQLIEVLKRDKQWSRASYRAAEELALSDKLDEPAWTALIASIARGVGQGGPPVSVRYMDALAAAGEPAVPDILRAFQEAGWEYRRALLLSLGRMGPAAKQAIPAFRKMLAKLKEGDKATMRIVLANLGDDSKENLDAILADLKAGNSASMLLTLPFIRPRQWVSDAMIAELARPVRGLAKTKLHRALALDGADWSAMALGMLGERAASEADTLEAVQKISLELEHLSAFPYTLALARVDPKRQHAALTRFLKTDRVGPNTPAGIFWVTEYPYLLLDARLSQGLAECIGDPDPQTAERAMLFLGLGGLAARDAVPHVVRKLRGKAAEELRVTAAQTLAGIAEYKQLPEMEAALKEEKSEKVREALAKAIQFIKDLPSEDD